MKLAQTQRFYAQVTIQFISNKSLVNYDHYRNKNYMDLLTSKNENSVIRHLSILCEDIILFLFFYHIELYI